MHITQESDYAIRIVYCLAKSGGRRDARSISEEMCVTLRFSLKILGKLASSGIVNSYKGNRGGYELASAPSQVSLKDVITGWRVQPGSFGNLHFPAGVPQAQRRDQPKASER